MPPKGKNPGKSSDLDSLVSQAEVAVASGGTLADPDNPDPIELGERVASPEAITDKLIERATAGAEEWKSHLLHPKRHPIKEGIKAEGKYKDKMEEVLRTGSRAKALEKVSDDDFLAGVNATDPSDFSRAVERKRAKILRRESVLQPLWKLVATILDTFPVDSDAQREKKLLAARKGQILVGQVKRGVISVDKLRSDLEAMRGSRAGA